MPGNIGEAIDIANEIYGIQQVEYEKAVDIIEAYGVATGADLRGAVMFGEEMIDEASRKIADVTAKMGERQGVTYRRTPADIPAHERAAWREENLAEEIVDG